MLLIKNLVNHLINNLGRQYLYFALALFLAFLAYWLSSVNGMAEKPAIMLAITVLTVVCWISEALPIPVTSLIPFALLPLFNIVDHSIVSTALGSHVIVLLMGAFMLSKAIEHNNLHQRLAIYALKLVGVNSAKRLVFAFMGTAAILSMWISNTATTLIMLPIALAILAKLDNPRLTTALLLSIAYGASVGGVGTPIGTPPNVIFMAIYQEQVGQSFSFLDWMKIGIPVVILAIPIMALWLTRHVQGKLALSLPSSTPWQLAEKRVLIVFALTILAWITREEPFGGWAGLLDIEHVGDSTIALVAVIVMFLVPDGKAGRLLNWQTAVSIPWGTLLLFAGGIALAKGFVASGLSQLIGQSLTIFADFPVILMVLSICLLITYLTEITSNTATATLLLPILAATASAINVDPLLLMIPATICASCAFMLPVATAPNAIVYATDKIAIKTMAKEGCVLSILTVLVATLVCYLGLA